MVGVAGRSGRKFGSKTKIKPFLEALQMELAEQGPDHKALRRISKALIEKAAQGDTTAIRELADRIDGKVPQGITGADDGPVRIQFEWTEPSEPQE